MSEVDFAATRDGRRSFVMIDASISQVQELVEFRERQGRSE